MIEQQFIEYVVKQLVSEPDQVKVVRTDDDRGTLLELSVAPDGAVRRRKACVHCCAHWG